LRPGTDDGRQRRERLHWENEKAVPALWSSEQI